MSANSAVKELLESVFGKKKIKASDFYNLQKELFLLKICILLLIILIMIK